MSNLPNKQEFIDNIVKLAAEKPEFKEKLLNNPKKVIESILKTEFPNEFEVSVFEDTPSKLNIVLPDTSEELSSVELNAVSGGFCWSDTICSDW